NSLISMIISGMLSYMARLEPPHASLLPARGEQVIVEDEQLSIAQSDGRLQGPVLLAVVDLDAWAKRPRRSVETPVPETELVLVLVDEMHAGAVRDGAQGRPVVDAVGGLVGERGLRGAPGAHRVRGVTLHEACHHDRSVLVRRVVVTAQQ